jgi:hypothetical protein
MTISELGPPTVGEVLWIEETPIWRRVFVMGGRRGLNGARLSKVRKQPIADPRQDRLI